MKNEVFLLKRLIVEPLYDIIIENLHSGRKPFSQTNFGI